MSVERGARVSLFVMGTRDGSYADLCSQVVEAERLGFHGAWLAERHFANGDLFCPSPIPVLGALAARTTRIRLGLAARVLPFHHPLAVAEEALTLDLLSDGRFDLGIARLSMDGDSHEAFDVSVDTAAERFPAALSTLRAALLGKVRHTDLPCTPTPVQRPHPPVYLVANRPESRATAAAQGLHSFVNGALPPAGVADAIAGYRSAAAEAGHDPDALDIPVNRFVFVGRSVRDATETMRPAFLEFMRERAPDLRDALLRLYGEEALTWEWLSANVCITGDSSTCAQRLQELIERTGCDHVLATLNLVTLDHATCVASMRRFAEHVMPALSSTPPRLSGVA